MSTVSSLPLSTPASVGPTPKPRVTPLATWCIWRVIVVSCLILIPVFWQEHIQADDLSSHLYNAWLHQEIKAGHIEGLSVRTQYTNVLFDHLLSSLMAVGGPATAEHVAVALAVLVFFWGLFSLLSAAAGQAIWAVTPLLAILAYGPVFRMGFFNFYIATGIAAAAGAVLLRKSWRAAPVAAALLVLAWLAHNLPVIWIVALISYTILVRHGNRLLRPVIPLAAVSGLVLLHLWLKQQGNPWSLSSAVELRMSWLGIDTGWLYKSRYLVVCFGLLATFAVSALTVFENRSSKTITDPWMQISALSAFACFLIPSAITGPGWEQPIGFVTLRLSMFTFIALTAAFATGMSNVLARAISITAALIFFAFSWNDERQMNELEARIAEVVVRLPERTRVVGVFRDPENRLPTLDHLLDRACIGHAYDFGNYEPSSSHFRLVSKRANPVVMHRREDVQALETIGYIVKSGESPLYEIRLCGDNNGLCATVLRSGDRTRINSIRVLGDWPFSQPAAHPKR